jgi:hypothetical protein
MDIKAQKNIKNRKWWKITKYYYYKEREKTPAVLKSLALP